MILISAGVVVLLGTGALFWLCLPREGREPLVTSNEAARYVPIVIIAGVACGLALIFTGASH